MKLYGYFRSSAVFRVRIALNLKNIPYDNVFIHLLKGEERTPAYLRLNPQGLIPALQDGSHLLTQSLAIIEYLEETQPQPPLLPATPVERVRVRALALMVACEIHPLNNTRVLAYLRTHFQLTPEQETAWHCHWMAAGLEAFERRLVQDGATGRFCHGDAPGLADLCLIPQVFNAHRVNCPLEPYPTIRRIFDECLRLDAFDRAQPGKQPDAE